MKAPCGTQFKVSRTILSLSPATNDQKDVITQGLGKSPSTKVETSSGSLTSEM